MVTKVCPLIRITQGGMAPLPLEQAVQSASARCHLPYLFTPCERLSTPLRHSPGHPSVVPAHAGTHGGAIALQLLGQALRKRESRVCPLSRGHGVACQRATAWAMVRRMGLKKLYSDIYDHFTRARDAHKGFDFQEEVIKSVPPPSVSFQDRVKWWTFNRPQRLRRIEQERDRQQQDILALKRRTKPTS